MRERLALKRTQSVLFRTHAALLRRYVGAAEDFTMRSRGNCELFLFGQISSSFRSRPETHAIIRIAVEERA